MCQMRLWRKGCCYIDHYNVGWLETPVSFFHWNIIYYILKGTLDLDFVLGLFIYWRLVFSLIGFFFSVNESILFWYCSTVLLFFIYNITHVLQMWHTQHMYYTCDSKKTSVQNFLIAGWDNCWYNFVLNLFCKQDVL